MEKVKVSPDERDVKGFAAFMDSYRKGLVIEKTASENFA